MRGATPVRRPFLRAGSLIASLWLIATGATAGPVQWRKVGDTAGFPGLRRELQSIVASRRGGGARFCVVVRDDGADPILYALWPSAQRLYRWSRTRDLQLGEATLLLHEPLDLKRDIIRSPSDRTSTYKVSRAWVADVELQCRRHGESVTLTGSRS
jgi:hypothetical protein